MKTFKSARAAFPTFRVILLFSLVLAVSSCKESIDDGNFAFKTEQTVTYDQAELIAMHHRQR